MKIPEIIRIGSCDYSVEFTSSPIVVDRKECNAAIHYDTHHIEIRNTETDFQSNEISFLHEVVHGIMHERNLELPEDEREMFVEGMARGLHQIIRDNQGIFNHFVI